MAGTIINNPVVQYFDNNGNPLVGGKITTYLSNTTTPASTWQNEALSTLNTNPIILNARGEATIWLTPDIQYTFVVTDADDNLIQTVNDIYGAFQVGVNEIPSSGIDYTPPVIGASETNVKEVLDNFIYASNLGKSGGNTIANLVGIVPDGTAPIYYDAVSYYGGYALSSVGPQGGGLFVWNSSKNKSEHDGGTIISPTVPWNGTQATVAAFLAGTGETDPGGSGCWVRVNQNEINCFMFGLTGLGVATNEAPSIQAAVNTNRLVKLPLGGHKTTETIIFGQSTKGMIGENYAYADGGSYIDYTGPDAAIQVLDTETAFHIVTALVLDQFGINVRSEGAIGLDFSHASYSKFGNIWIRLNASFQTGVYGKGNEIALNSAPYYNTFNCQVFGNTDGVTVVTQRGYFFDGDDGGLDADGPNGNIITNVGRVSGVEVAFDIHSGNGNMFSNIGIEAVRSYCFKFGDGVGAPGRADGNRVTNVRVEGLPSAVFARFVAQADDNRITNYFAVSLSNVRFENLSSGYENICTPKGIVYVANFYGSDIPANTTTSLSPISTGNEGGIVIPFASVPYSMHVTVNRFISGGLGNGVVNTYRSGIVNPNLSFTINNANRFGGRSIQTSPDSSQTYNSFDGQNGFCAVDITTDATWDQTTADVHVQIIFLG